MYIGEMLYLPLMAVIKLSLLLFFESLLSKSEAEAMDPYWHNQLRGLLHRYSISCNLPVRPLAKNLESPAARPLSCASRTIVYHWDLQLYQRHLHSRCTDAFHLGTEIGD